jgi:hypothetical protein
MDTEKLRFKTGSDGWIEGREQQEVYRFYMVGYRNTRSRDQEAALEPFRYSISNHLYSNNQRLNKS